MSLELQSMLNELSEFWLHYFLVFVRISAFVSLLPAFGERSVPMRIKLVLAFCFTAIIAPAVPDAPKSDFLVNAIFIEATIGLILGALLRFFVISLQVAGVIAAQSTSLSQLMGGAAADPIPAMGHVLVVGGLTLAVLSGLHEKAAFFMIQSYIIFPLGIKPSAALVSELGLSRVATCFALAFSLAAPFVILSALYNLALGAINKAMPQLMVAFVGAPLITAGGLGLLFVSAPIILSFWIGAMDQFIVNPSAR